MLLNRAFLIVFSLTLTSLANAAELKVFQPGEVIRSADINQNFESINQAIETAQTGSLSCTTISAPGSESASCAPGQILVGGGFSLSDPAGSVAGSYPAGNGWRCNAGTGTSLESLTCFARCCGASNTAFAQNRYCTSNYCWENTANYPSYDIHTHYAMTLLPGEFRIFPIEIDDTFVFPPENIGAASLLVRYQGGDYHVTNIDEQCLAEDADRHWSDCLSQWENGAIFEAAMRSGSISVAPGPLNILDEFRIESTSGAALRVNVKLSSGSTVDDARLESTGYTAYRVEEGTGNRNGGSCQEHSILGATSVGGIVNQEGSNARFFGTQDATTPANFNYPFRTLLCSDSPVGTFTYKIGAVDGLGGKRFLGEYTVIILEERKPGGQIIPN
jgi:hypothetical protein